MEVIGWAGTTLVIVAYCPQIYHLWAEKCAWGVSLLTWLLWLVAALLLLAYAVSRQEALFIIVQSINIIAIVTTIILVGRSNRVCPYHLGVTGKKSIR